MRANPLPLADEQSRPGIVFAFSFNAEGQATELPISEMPALDAQGVGFWWVHVNIVDKRGRDWIGSLVQLPDEAKQVLVSAEAHDRIDIEGDALFGVFVDLRLDFAKATEDMAQLRFALKPRLLVTARRHSLRSIEATRAAVMGGRRAECALDLLEAIVDREADAVAAAATELGHSVDAIEDKILEGHDHDAHDGIGAIRRRAVRLNRQLSRLLGLFRRVELAPPLRIPQDVRDAAGRIAQRLESIHQEIHASQERARLLQDEVAAHMAAETNRQLYILSMLTAVFLPATLVTGIFGMNTKGLPFTEEDSGFWWACGLGVAAAAVVFLGLVLLIRRRPGGH
jgi:zinc transporter